MTPEEFARTNAGVGILRHELGRHLNQIDLLTKEIEGAEGHIKTIEAKIIAGRRRLSKHESDILDIRTVLSSLGVLSSIDEGEK